MIDEVENVLRSYVWDGQLGIERIMKKRSDGGFMLTDEAIEGLLYALSSTLERESDYD